HPHISEAAAEHAGHGLLDLLLAGIGILVQECLGRHDDAADTETTLGRLFLDEGLLQRVRLLYGSDPFERGDLCPFHRLHRCDAGADGLALDDDRACAALSQATAKLRAA